MTQENKNIFKILRQQEWQELSSSGEFWGSEHDKRDGFIHLSTIDQVEGVKERYFSDVRPIVIVELSIDQLQSELVWEEAKSGGKYPHLYDQPLKKSQIIGSKEISD